MKRLALPLAALVLVLLSGWFGWQAFVPPRGYLPRPLPPAPGEGDGERGAPVRLVVDPVPPDPGGSLVPEDGGKDADEDESEEVGEGEASGDALVPEEDVGAATSAVVSAPRSRALPRDILDVRDPWLLRTSGSANPLGVGEVEGGFAWIGTPLGTVRGWARRAGGRVPEGLLMEAPRHRVALEPFGIAPYETTQQSWRSFLQDTALVWVETPFGDAATLVELIVLLAGSRAPEPWDLAASVYQCYVANQGALQRVYRDRVVEAPDGTVDLERTFEVFSKTPLPTGLRLRFYERPPPRHWVGLDPPAGTEDHPVRDLSPADAVAYAWWSGLCLPSEEQWEYACRGPNGWAFPWGNGGGNFDERVNGGHLPPRGEVPRTVPVRALPEGASWAGVVQTLGNVSEWTSSWLDPYPASSLPGRLVPVFRGGSAADAERLLVRPAFRGWDVEEDTPHWRGRRPWTGVRPARLAPDVGSNAVVNMHMEARAWGRADAGLLQDQVYDLVVGRILKRYDEAVLVRSLRRGVKTFCVQPLARVAAMDPATGVFLPGLPEDVLSREDLVESSVSGTPVLLGLVRIGLGLEGVWREREGRRRSDRLVLDPARVAAGTWWIGLLHGHAALLSLDLEHARYLTRTVVPSAVLNVRSASGRARASLDLEPDGSQIGVVIEVPVSPPGTAGAVIRLRTRFQVLPSLRAKVPRWIPRTSR